MISEVAKILIAFGQDFEYENWGSKGEHIVSFEASVEVYNQNGVITFIYLDRRTHMDNMKENTEILCKLVEEACIDATT